MKEDEDFLPDADLDRLIATALQARVEAMPSPDLAARSARLAREQERVQLQNALAARLAQWERRKWWQRGASAVAAIVVLAILFLGAQRLKQMELAKGESAATSSSIEGTSNDGTTTEETSGSSTSTSANEPLVLGGIALLGAVALLTIGRSLGCSEAGWAFATPRLT